jgi:hypothetical protein
VTEKKHSKAFGKTLGMALAVGASLTVIAASATPAFAATAHRAATPAPALWCTNCDDGTIGIPGPGQDDPGGWGVSHNIGKGQQDANRNRHQNPPPRHSAQTKH